MKVKVHCPCETRFEFEVEPVNNRMPVAINCPGCGADATELANAVIQQQSPAALAAPHPAAAAPSAKPVPILPNAPAAPATPAAHAAPAAPAVRIPKPQGTAAAVNVPTPALAPPPAAQPGLRMKAHAAAPAEAAPDAQAAPAAPAGAPAVQVGKFCYKHQTQPAIESCRVCKKPICAQCMTQFGYVCSIFCRDQAANKKIVVPRFAGQKQGYQDQPMSGRTKLIIAGVVVALLAAAGVGIWYEYVAREPKVIYTAELKKPNEDAAEFVAQDHYDLIGPNRLLALKDKRVSLMDVQKQQDLWTTPLQTDAEASVEKAAREKNAEIVKNAPMVRDGDGRVYKKIQGLDPMAWHDEQELSDPKVIATTNDIWMVFKTRLFRLDRQSGAKKDLGFADKILGVRAAADSILVTTRTEAGARNLIRIAAADGAQQSEELSAAPAPRGGARGTGTATNAPGARSTMAAATPTNRPAANPMTTAAAPRGMAPGARAAGPGARRGAPPVALSTNSANNAIALARAAAGTKNADVEDFSDYFDTYSMPYIVAGPNVVEFKTKLLERRTSQRQAMKPAPAPGKSVLDDKNLTASRGIDLAEEMANQSQREATGGVELQNVSRYEVTVHRRFAPGAEDWKGEVIGEPAFVPLETVDLVTGFSNIIAFDKSNKKLWEAKLTFPVPYYSRFFDDEEEQPALETKDAIYFADKGMVTCFEKGSGAPRWRYNTVGTSRITADAKGDIYVDCTTDHPESIKYSQEVSFRDKAELQIVKLEAATGKKVWDTKYQSDQYQCRPTGKFLYSTRTWQIQDPLRLEEGPDTLFNIKLLKPSSGAAIWTYPVPGKHPNGAQIQDKWILLKFREKILVLNFFSL